MKSKLILILGSVIALLVALMLYNSVRTLKKENKRLVGENDAIKNNIINVQKDLSRKIEENKAIKLSEKNSKQVAKKIKDKCSNVNVSNELNMLLQNNHN